MSVAVIVVAIPAILLILLSVHSMTFTDRADESTVV